MRQTPISKRAQIWRGLGSVLLLVYLLAVVKVTLLPLPPAHGWFSGMHQPRALWELNLMPFESYGSRQLLGNLILGIPFGVLLPWVVRWPTRWLAIACGAFGVVIESCQLLLAFASGGFYRSVDVTDAILNGVGALIGLGAMMLATRMSRGRPPLR